MSRANMLETRLCPSLVSEWDAGLLRRSFQLPAEVLAPILADVLIDPLLAHNEIVSLGDYLRHTLRGANHASHEVGREPCDLHVIDINRRLVDSDVVVGNGHDLEH